MKIFKFAGLISLLFLLNSCYTLQFKVENGVGEPEDTETEVPWEAGHLVRKRYETIKSKIHNQDNIINIKDCESGSIYAIEYKSTFGGILLSVVTFGTRKAAKLRYICSEQTFN